MKKRIPNNVHTCFLRNSHCILLILLFVIFYRPSYGFASAHQLLSLEQRFSCQKKIEDLNFSHRIWPESNFISKPSRSDVINDQQILEQVIDIQRIEAALTYHFGFEISTEMLQSELDRMARHSKVPQRLKELFDLLENNPTTLAECIARPALVKKNSYERYYWSAELHNPVREQAEMYLQNLNKNLPQSAQQPKEQHLVFEIKDNPDENTIEHWNKDKSTDGVHKIYLDTAAFHQQVIHTTGRSLEHNLQVMDELSFESKLQESLDGFVFYEVLELTSTSLQVHRLTWDKIGFNEWWNSERSRFNVSGENTDSQSEFHTSLTVPKISAASTTLKPSSLSYSIASDSWLPRNAMNLPITYHIGVWTGNEMIIWGGYDDTNTLINEGGRYNPTTDQWVPTTSVGAPSARYYHTGIWTGTEMIVWGGFVPSTGDTKTGGRYNPATDSWQETSTINAPVEREFHSAVWTGNEMIIWGGYAHPIRSSTITGGRYNPVADTWVPTSIVNVPIDTMKHSAVWTGAEMIVWGGSQYTYPGFYRTNLGGRYDPVTDIWTATNIDTAPTARHGHTAVWTGEEMIVWGGDNHQTGGRYSPATDSWVETRTYNAPSARTQHSAVWTGSEMIVYGGAVSTASYAGGRYDPVSNMWQTLSSVHSHGAGSFHSTVWTGEEMIVWGGGGTYSGGRYNPVQDSWKIVTLTGEPIGRAYNSVIWTGNKMIVWGGAGYVDTGGLYNPITDTWNSVSFEDAPSGRAYHTAVWTGTEMIIWGGGQSSSGSLNSGGRYNPDTDSWSATQVDGAPPTRKYHTAVWSGSEMIIWGGSPTHNLGGRYNPVSDSWQAVSTTGSPSDRYSHTAVWSGAEMIIWGGFQSNTGGRYNPVSDSWVPTSTTLAPTGRSDHTAIWTGSEMIVWGGNDSIGLPPFGGRYNPSSDTWLETDVSGSPTERQYHTAIWTGSEMIIWGGQNSSSSYLNNGSRYNPSTDSWTPTTIIGAPTARAYHTAVWTGREMLVWGGGNHGASSLGKYYPYSLFDIGGSVSGLASGNNIVVQNNAGNDLSINSNGEFSFTAPLSDGSSYSATVVEINGATSQTCSVVNGSGIVSAGDITSIQINCSDIIRLPGDINEDGYVDLQDAILGLQVTAGKYPAGISTNGDVNGDSVIGIQEIIYSLDKASD